MEDSSISMPDREFVEPLLLTPQSDRQSIFVSDKALAVGSLS